MSSGRLLASAALALCFAVSPATAQFDAYPPQVDDDTAKVNDHGRGFFLRFSLGVGNAGTRADAGSQFTELFGWGPDFNIALGGIIAPDLALHGTVFGFGISDPEVESHFGEVGPLEGSVNLVGIGAGLTYYFMPENVYLSGSLGLGRLVLEAGSTSYDLDIGFASDVTIGKEWWVSDSWGMGVAGGLGFHSVPFTTTEVNWSGVSVGVRFTATMN